MLGTVADSGVTVVGQTDSLCLQRGEETRRKYTKIQILKGTYVWLRLSVILMFLLRFPYMFYNYIMPT